MYAEMRESEGGRVENEGGRTEDIDEGGKGAGGGGQEDGRQLRVKGTPTTHQRA